MMNDVLIMDGKIYKLLYFSDNEYNQFRTRIISTIHIDGLLKEKMLENYIELPSGRITQLKVDNNLSAFWVIFEGKLLYYENNYIDYWIESSTFSQYKIVSGNLNTYDDIKTTLKNKYNKFPLEYYQQYLRYRKLNRIINDK